MNKNIENMTSFAHAINHDILLIKLGCFISCNIYPLKYIN